MIGRIAGRIDYRSDDHVLIDVRGIGYLVYCSERTLAGLPSVGEHVALYTDLLVREDNLQLFGFPTLVEKEWHRLLMSVQGIGAKASLAILGALGADGVGRAIALGDWMAVKSAKGVGPKIAQRVVLDLKDKAAGVMALGATRTDTNLTTAPDEDAVIEPVPEASAPSPRGSSGGTPDAQSEALSALGNLGYAPSEAVAAVAQAAHDTPGADTAQLIRASLRLLAPKG